MYTLKPIITYGLSHKQVGVTQVGKGHMYTLQAGIKYGLSHKQVGVTISRRKGSHVYPSAQHHIRLVT